MTEFDQQVRDWRARLGDDRMADGLLALPRVEKALATQDPLAVHAALRRERRGPRSFAERLALDRLLADQRAFARTFGVLPLLSTAFGLGFLFGARKDVDPVSATYLATRWLVVLFVPLWPVAPFLGFGNVSDSVPRSRGRPSAALPRPAAAAAPGM